MKFVVLFLTLFSLASASPYKALDGLNFNSFERQGRIALGDDGKKGENLDFCYITVNFYEKQKTCGCIIATEKWVVTTARCVYE